MEMEALAERILSDITSVFKRDPYVDEFDIISVFEAQNKSPVAHVAHKLALESWCVKHLYYYCYNKLFDWKEKRRNKVTDPEKVLRWTSAVLLLNPDISTAWNVRKEMLLSGSLSSKHELRFSFVVLTRKPKSPEVFAHRKWLLSCIMNNQFTTDVPLETLVEREMELCSVTASRYPNNYHAWNHRIWVVKELTKHSNEILAKEISASQDWISLHVSDHSGMQYRQYLLDSFINTSNDQENEDIICQLLKSANLLSKELDFSNQLIFLYPGHEALWYHRRYVIHASKKLGLFSNNHLTNISATNNAAFGPLCKKTKLMENNLLMSLEKELVFIEQCFVRFQNDAVQLSLALKYKKWLTSCLEMTT